VIIGEKKLGDFIETKAKKSPTSPGLVSPEHILCNIVKIFFSETAEQKSAKLAINVHWMVLYQICFFGTDLKSNMAARVHNVFALAEKLA
jgi:hypothetical protein